MLTDAPTLVVGGFLWSLILYPMWSPRCRRIRKKMRVSGNHKPMPKNMEPIQQDWLELGDDLDG